MLTQVVLDLLDATSDDPTPRGRIEAREARLPRGGDAKPFQSDYENRVQLSDLDARFERGLPIAGLHMSSPEAELDATDSERILLTSDARLELDSAELVGAAVGYRLEIVRRGASRAPGAVPSTIGPEDQLIELRRQGWLELRSASGEATRAARFSATGDGPVQVRRQGRSEPRPILLEAWEGARLELEGDSGAELTAAHMQLVGTQANAAEVISLRRLEADGDVLWSSPQGVYSGRECAMEFDASSRPTHVSLRGFPTARIVLDIDPERVEGEIGELNVDAVRVASDELLELTVGVQREMAIRAAGPATVDTTELSLRSNGDLHATVDATGDRVSFRGAGGVVVESENGTLETAILEIAFRRAEGGATMLRGIASGGARLAGVLRDGRSFLVTSPELLEVERRGGNWHVIDGVKVDMSVGELGDEGGFRASCDRLTDLDLARESWTAIGDVSLDNGRQTVECDRLVAEGPERFSMWGKEGDPAVLTSPEGQARAQFVSVEGDRLEARGKVAAAISSYPAQPEQGDVIALDHYALTSEELTLERSETRNARGHVERRLHVEAAGAVRTTLTTNERVIELRHADELVADRFDELDESPEGTSPVRSRTWLQASGAVVSHLDVEGSDLDLSCARLEVTRETAGEAPPTQEVVAVGDVRFSGTREIRFRGQGDSLVVHADRTAELAAAPSKRIELAGTLPESGLPFRLTGTNAAFSDDQIEAQDPEIFVRHYTASAKRMTAARRAVELTGDARLEGTTKDDMLWVLEAGVVSVDDAMPEDGVGTRTKLPKVRASGGFSFTLGTVVVATGDSITPGSPPGVLRMSGRPVSIKTPYATGSYNWINFDPELRMVLGSGSGTIRETKERRGDGAPSGPGQETAPEEEPSWEVSFLNASTLLDQDSAIYIMQEPVLRYPKQGSVLRASWVVLWIDRDQLARISGGEEVEQVEPVPGPQEAAPPGVMGIFFNALNESQLPGLVREAYFEGPVEALRNDERIALADAVYLDMVSGHGWFANADVRISGRQIDEDFEKLRVNTAWLRHSKDGTLRAERATITSCSFDEPHVQVVTGDLRLTPLPGGDEGYEVKLTKNRIELYDWLRIPLPPLHFDTDEELKPRLPSLSFGNSARFGQLFSLKLRGSAKRLGRWLHRLFSPGSGEEDDQGDAAAPDAPPAAEAAEGAEAERAARRRREKLFDTRYDIDASYLGSRGALFDVGLSSQAPDDYWFELLTGIVVDRGRDKGLIRVPEDERDDLRLWLRAHGRFELPDSELILSYSDESDPGVQSEFFESDFYRYDRRESYLQWKRRDGHLWGQISVQPRIDEFRATVEELPSATAYRSRAPIARLGSLPVVHNGRLDAAYLRRVAPKKYDVDGDGFAEATLTSPFGPSGIYPDGTSTRDVLRVDTEHTLELPIPTGVLGIKLVPFASARGTAWNNASDEDDATRGVSEVGIGASTVFWKNLADGGYHQVAPYARYRSEIASSMHGTPFVFDETETAVFGDFIEVGTRSRFGVQDGRSRFDLDVIGTHASDRSDGRRDGWLPIEIYGRLGFGPEEQTFDVWYDGRYDTRGGESVYSLFALGTRFDDTVGLQLSHTLGRDDTLQKIFDAISVAGFYRWTEKWEFEARHTYSLLSSDGLDLDVLLRRYGHDFIFELETNYREGEGSSFSVSGRPRIGYRPGRIGYVRY